MKVRSKVRAQRLIGNAAMDLFAINDSQKPDYPSDAIIGFTRGECYLHELTAYPPVGRGCSCDALSTDPRLLSSSRSLKGLIK